MVVDLRYIGAGFAALALVQIFLSYSFDASIEEKKRELHSKRETLTELSTLQEKWSTKSQKAELESIYKLLDVFDIPFSTSEKRKRKVITLNLKNHNADKVMGLILNKGVDIKELQIEKTDAHTLKLIVEIL